MSWVELFAVFCVSHVVGDFILQTDWQALNKFGGLGPDRESRRALASHVLVYTLAFAPALVWAHSVIGLEVLWLVPAIALPHWIQDDGRLVVGWMRHVKKATAQPGALLFIAVDQSFHAVALLGAALLASAF